METESAPHGGVRVGGFELDIRTRELRVGATRVERLTPTGFLEIPHDANDLEPRADVDLAGDGLSDGTPNSREWNDAPTGLTQR